MKKKRFLSLTLAAVMIIGTVPLTVLAGSKNFSGRKEMSWKDATKGWGTVSLSESKILKAGEGEEVENISSSKSVFNNFKYYRGQDYYSGFSKNTKFVYDTSQSDYGASLGGGRYLYAVYNDSSDKNNYKVDFAASFNGALQKLIKKGDLEVAIAAETDNYKGSTNKHRGVANLRFYASDKSNIQQEITTQEEWYDGTRTVYTGWQKLNSDISRMIMNIRSSRTGLKKWNGSSVQKIRVFLRDTKGPEISSCGIENGGSFRRTTNIAGDEVYTVRPGDTVRLSVKFNENIKIDNEKKSEIKLKVTEYNPTNKQEPYNDKNTNSFIAEFKEAKDDRLIFEYKIPDNTEMPTELKVKLNASSLSGTKYITDIAGNPLTGSTTVSMDNDKYLVDDTYTRFNKRAFTDNNMKFYPQISNMTSSARKCNVYGEVPAEIVGANGSQPIMFSAESGKCPIFRIVLDDEIQKSCLNGSTKLKLKVYDVSGNPTDSYAYADLVGARVVGVSKGAWDRGVKSDAYTELYFKYTPNTVSGYDMYKLNFAGAYDRDNKYFVCDNDLLTYSGGKFKNIANMEVDGSYLKIPKDMSDLMPLNIGVTVDNKAPEFKNANVSTEWSKAFNSDASLTFTDEGGFDSVAKISIVYWDKNNNKQNLGISYGENGKPKKEPLELSVSSKDGEGTVRLNNIHLNKDYPADYDLYLEYEVKDKSGNTASNKDKKDIRLYLDNTAPTVGGVSQTPNGKGAVDVKFDVTDTGIGTISDTFYYRLKNLGGNEPLKEGNKEDKTRTYTVTPKENSLDDWKVFAQFVDGVGNRSSEWAESPTVTTADRSFNLGFTDKAKDDRGSDAVVSDKHSITLNPITLPSLDSKTYLDVTYGWKKGSSGDLSVESYLKSYKSETKKFTSEAELNAFDFAAEKTQKDFGGGNPFDGEYTLLTKITLMPENKTQIIQRSFYFDSSAPTGTLTIDKKREGVNPEYDINYYLTDAAAEYCDGAYTTEKNIDFSSGNAPVMKLYIGDKLADSFTLSSFNSTKSINFYESYADKAEFKDETTAYAEVTFKDKFGHEATIKSDVMKIDLKAPEITEIKVSPEFKHPACDENAYIINSFSDIASITAQISDNTDDKLDITRKENGFYKTSRIDGRSVTITKPLEGDFDGTYEDGAYKYKYDFGVTDMGKNFTSKSVSFVTDTAAPEVYFTDMSGIIGMTNAESREVILYYRTDGYERPEDINVAVSGAESIDKTEVGVLKLTVKNNGQVKVTLTDKQGKQGEKSFNVSCFDRELPKIERTHSSQMPEEGAAKYGEMTISVSDNDSLTVLGAAITKGEPSDTDFFEDTAGSRIIRYDGEGDETVPVYSENGYFDDSTGMAYASLIMQNNSSAQSQSGAAAEYKLYYGALPTGEYQVWARVSDAAGNAAKVNLGTISASNAEAEAETTYTPNTATGGAVTAKVTTDIPTQLLGDVNSDDNVEAMQKNAEKKRDAGYTYIYNGETKTLTFDEAKAKFTEIAKKYNHSESLTEEEKQLVKYDPSEDASDIYNNFLTDKKYIEPAGDMLDYLVNACLCEKIWDYEKGDYIDEENGLVASTPDNEECSNLHHIFNLAGLTEGIPDDPENPDYPESKPIIKVPNMGGWQEIDLKNYPAKIDSFDVPKIDESMLTPVKDEDGNVQKDENGNILYENPFNPFMPQQFTYEEIIKTLEAIKRMQTIRSEVIEGAADKYAISFMSITGTSAFSTEHKLIFTDNVNKTYALMDEMGRKTELPIKIDWIDHKIPYVPQENITFSIDADGKTPLDKRYTNESSATVTVTLPSDGVFSEYRLKNLPNGANPDNADECRSFTLTVTENGTVEFDVTNPTPTVEDTLHHQVYTVDRFDRTAPTYDVTYSPSKPSNGSCVNTDVTVSISNIKDNCSARDNITIDEESHTFDQNGTYTFTITDEAGNETTVPINVDYIDKNPTSLDVTFTSGNKTVEGSAFNKTTDENDYKNSTYTYEYTSGNYLNHDVEAVVSYKDTPVGLINIDNGDEYTFTYTAPNGSRGTVVIKGMKIDKEAPTATVTYNHIAASGGNKDYVEAHVTLIDNLPDSTITLESVTGRDNSGKEYTVSDVKNNVVRFDNNGFANLVYKDGAGNTTEVRLNVTNLDRTPPRAFISYSSETPTNSDVVATITLDKLADYQIFEQNDTNTPIKNYTNSYSATIDYTFEDNGTKVFRFRDVSGNETDYLLASVNNIDKVKPELGYNIIENKMVSDDGKTLKDLPGAATIELIVKSAGDCLDGSANDTVFIENAAQSIYHSVMSNGRYNFKYRDAAGNFDTLYVDVNCIDTEKPTASDSGNPNDWINKAPTITVTASPKSNGKGTETFIVQNGKEQKSVTFTPTENGKYSFLVKDAIGNTSTYDVNVEYVDLNAPKLVVDKNNEYGGYRDIYVKPGEFDKNAFEAVTVEDTESGAKNSKAAAVYDPLFNENTPGSYKVTFSGEDNAGNKTTLERTVCVIGENDVFAKINGDILIPNGQTEYALGDKLTLSFMNADSVGNKVSYAFEKGFYNGAQMKGKSFKKLVSADSTIELKPESTGMYTLFVQTENRKVMVMYVFIAG